ncbi:MULTISPECIES: hypothetical protein [Aphanothece]|uniref:hypothetical protein n=1 Tax=Aphanothece TaxID=1121 RepID=UPI003984B15D
MANLAQFPFTPQSDTAESLVNGWVLGVRKVDALRGNDIIRGNAMGCGICNGGIISAGRGNDLLEGTNPPDSVAGPRSIANWGEINAGPGNDTIRAYGRGGILNHGSIRSGLGDDEILGVADNNYPREQAEEEWTKSGIVNAGGEIITGDGDDSVVGESSVYSGISNNIDGVIETRSGADVVRGDGYLFGIANDGSLKTGSGRDVVTGAGAVFGIRNSGLIATGDGNDVLDAFVGGFSGQGKASLGRGNDTLIGFVSESGKGNRSVVGVFLGGRGSDKVLLGDGVYRLDRGRIGFVGDGRVMKTKSFERIGGVDGGLFNFKDGILTIAGGVATSLI